MNILYYYYDSFDRFKNDLNNKMRTLVYIMAGIFTYMNEFRYENFIKEDKCHRLKVLVAFKIFFNINWMESYSYGKYIVKL